MKVTFRKETIFTLLMVAIAAFVVQQAATFPLGSGLYPLVIGIISLGLVLGQLLLELSGRAGVTEVFDIAVDEAAKGKVAMRRAMRFLAWFLGIYVATTLIGFQYTIILFFILFMRLEGHIRWRVVLLLTAIAAVAVLFYMPNALSMDWPRGLLQNLIELPF